MKSGSVLIAIGIGVFLGVVVVYGGLGAGFLWIVKTEMKQAGFDFAPVTGINYTLEGPTTVRVGESATFVIQVTNTSTSEPRTLHSLDLYTELVDQGEVIVNPEPQSTDMETGWEYGELIFRLPLAPGETRRVEVTLHPMKPGSYNVNIDACIDSAGSFIERFHDLEVLPATDEP